MNRTNFILTIGIDPYPGPVYPKLKNASGDAKRISDVLVKRYGFEAIPPILNEQGTHENIIDNLDSLCFNIGKEDNLIIYYAGHGNKNVTTDRGYWVPVDEGEKASHRILNATVLEYIQGISAKHIILISDSCFSGSFLESNRSASTSLDHDYLDSLNSGWILVSGGLDTVTDGKAGEGTPFNQTLCQLLETNKRPSLAAGEIFEEVIRITEERTRQLAQAAPIRGGNIHRGGQMIFRLPTTHLLPGTTGVAASEVFSFTIPEDKLPEKYIERTFTSYSLENTAINWFYQPEVGQVYLKDLIATQKRIIILGGAGSGKSIELLQQFKDLRQSKEGMVPIYKRFNTYTEENIEDYLPDNWEKVNPLSLILFLDGLDEIQPKFFSTAVRKIQSFSERFPQITIIVSCRTNFYELPTKGFGGTLDGFSVYMINDIAVSDIQKFVHDIGGVNPDSFLSDIHRNNFLDLAQKPYFLSILLNYFQKHNGLVPERATILEDAVNQYDTANVNQYRTTDVPVSAKKLLKLQEKIAFSMEYTGRNYISTQDLALLLPEQEEIDSCAFLAAFNFNQAESKWSFEHNNIQEYLASRVLSRQSFETMIGVVSITLAGSKKIKVNWINTLSFLISIGNDDKVQPLLDWIIENDTEVLIRFEPGRLTDDRRIAIFKDIFQNYSQKQVWLSSNKFSDRELARFGYFDVIVEYILDILNKETSTRIDLVNALYILQEFDIKDFAAYKDKIINTLLKLLDVADFNTHDLFATMSTISRLCFNDEGVIKYLVERYGKRENQYLRAGLYKLVSKSKYLDHYAFIFVDGLKFRSFRYTSSDREKVSLMDEEFLLKAGLAKLKSPDAIRTLLDEITREPYASSQFFSNYKDIAEEIINHIFEAYLNDRSLFKLLVDIFVKQAADVRKPFTEMFAAFFNEQNLKPEVVGSIINNPGLRDFEKAESIIPLIDVDIISFLVDQYSKGVMEKSLLEKVYGNFKWYETSLENFSKSFLYFNELLGDKTDIVITTEPKIDRAQLFKDRAQKDFDLLFDQKDFTNEVNRIFDFFEKEELSGEDIYSYRWTDLEENFSLSSTDLLQEFTYSGNQVSRKFINNWITGPDEFQLFQIRTIKERLSALPDLIVSAEQIDFIKRWCIERGQTGDLLWYFINRFDIVLSKDRVLDFTRHFNTEFEIDIEEPSFIEALHKFLDCATIDNEVRTNFQNGMDDMLVWTANAGYALRRDLKDLFEPIISYLQQSELVEYKFTDLLKFWFDKTGDGQRLTELINNTESVHLKEKAIMMLMDANIETGFLIDYFYRHTFDPSKQIDERLDAASRLLKLGVPDGFYFISEYFLKNSNPDFDFRRYFQNIGLITSVDVVPILMKLLQIGKQPEFKKDTFNDLERVVLDSLYQIGIQSENNFGTVRLSLEEFIKKNKGTLEHVNFLHFTITKIQEQFILKQSTLVSVDEARSMFEKLD